MLDRLAAQERKEVEGVLAVRAKYDGEKQKLDALIVTQTKQQNDLAAKKKQIDAEIKQLEASMPKTTVKTAACPTINGVVSEAARTAIKTACAQGRRSVRLGRHRPELVRLLGPDPVRLQGGRDLPDPPHR